MSDQQKSFVWRILGTLIILILFIVGYFVYTLKFDRTSQWGMEDIAPKKSQVLIKKAKDIKAEIAKEKVSQKEKQVEEKPENDLSLSEKLDTVKLQDQNAVIYFESNSNAISDEAYESLDKIARIFIKHPELEIIVKGYTDSFGTDAYNKKLSKFRAEIVKDYFISKGINPSRITVDGLGAQNFIAPNDTEHGRSLNRRVEIKSQSKH